MERTFLCYAWCDASAGMSTRRTVRSRLPSLQNPACLCSARAMSCLPWAWTSCRVLSGRGRRRRPGLTDGFDEAEMTMGHGGDRHTPYEAQLNQFLGRQPREPFSSRTLARRFENGHRDETSALRGIESELRQAFADGRLVQYRDADGEPLTESLVKKISSQRLGKPTRYFFPRCRAAFAAADEVEARPARPRPSGDRLAQHRHGRGAIGDEQRGGGATSERLSRIPNDQ
jgi:hypothetical protein